MSHKSIVPRIDKNGQSMEFIIKMSSIGFNSGGFTSSTNHHMPDPTVPPMIQPIALGL